MATGSKRHSGLIVALLLLVIAGSAWVIGRQSWAASQRQRLNAALANRDFRAARTHLRNCFRASPHDADLHLIAARMARREHKLEEAQRELEYYRANGGNSDIASFEERLTELQIGDPTNAAAFYQFALEHPGDPDSALALEALIEGSIARVDVRGATKCIALWQRRSDAAADLAQGWVWLGATRELINDFQSARDAYQKAVELDPLNREARLALVMRLIDEDAQAAARHLAVLREQSPEDPHVVYQRALLHFNLGRLDQAADDLNLVLDRLPQHIDALVMRARVAMAAGETEEAATWLKKAERLSPKHRAVLMAMIDYHRAAGNPAEAERYHQIMLETKAEVQRRVTEKLKSTFWLRSHATIRTVRAHRWFTYVWPVC